MNQNRIGRVTAFPLGHLKLGAITLANSITSNSTHCDKMRQMRGIVTNLSTLHVIIVKN